MIPVILRLHELFHFFYRQLVFPCQFLDRNGKIAFQLLARDPAKGFELLVHADISRLVEAAEHAYLREFGHPRQQDELQVLVSRLEYRVETFQDSPVAVFQRHPVFPDNRFQSRVEDIQNRLVILVDQYHGTTSHPRVSLSQDLNESHSPIPALIRKNGVSLFPSGNMLLDHLFQRTLLLKIAPVKINMKHRVFQPVFFQAVDCQPLEKFLSPEEIIL